MRRRSARCADGQHSLLASSGPDRAVAGQRRRLPQAEAAITSMICDAAPAVHLQRSEASMIGSHGPGAPALLPVPGLFHASSARGVWPVRRPARSRCRGARAPLLADDGGVHRRPAGRCRWSWPAGRLRWPGLARAGHHVQRAAQADHTQVRRIAVDSAAQPRPALPDLFHDADQRRLLFHAGPRWRPSAAADLTAHSGDAKAIETVSLDMSRPTSGAASTVRRRP